MKVFAASDYYKRFVKPLCRMSPDLSPGKAEILRYPNGEMHAVVHEDVLEQDCLLIGSVAPPDGQLLGVLTLADAIKHRGARLIQTFLPYLGYARQDKPRLGESSGIMFVGSLLKAAGISKVITIDIHSELAVRLLGIPAASPSAAPLFAPAIRDLSWGDVSIVAPDEGAVGRCRAAAETLGLGRRPPAHLVKKRIDGVQHLELVGEVGKQVLIIDDIIDTGKTLVSACSILKNKGVEDIAIAVTHGLFTGLAWKQLFELRVRALFVSDSCPETAKQWYPAVHVISLQPLLPAVLSEAMRKESRYENFVTQ